MLPFSLLWTKLSAARGHLKSCLATSNHFCRGYMNMHCFQECGFSHHAAQYAIEICHLPWLLSQWFDLRWYELFIIPIQVDEMTHTSHVLRLKKMPCWWLLDPSRFWILSYSLHPLNASLLEKRTICRQAHLKVFYSLWLLKLWFLSVKPPVFKYPSFQDFQVYPVASTTGM